MEEKKHTVEDFKTNIKIAEVEPDRLAQSITFFSSLLETPEEQLEYLSWAINYLENEIAAEPNCYILETNEDGTLKLNEKGEAIFKQEPSKRYLLYSDAINDIGVAYRNLKTVFKLYTKQISPQEKEPQAQQTTQQPEKIQWLGTETQLVYFFELLFKDGFLPMQLYGERFSAMAKHFKNRNGEAFDNEQLSQAQRNYSSSKKGTPRGAEKLENIMKEVKRLPDNSENQ